MLNDWLKDKDGAIIVFPPIYRSNEIIPYIASLLNKEYRIMSEILKSDITIEYKDSLDLRKLIKEDLYLLIDDISKFNIARIPLVLRNKSNLFKFILVLDWGFNKDDLASLKDFKLGYLKVDFLQEGPSLAYSLETTEMTPDQTKVYLKRRVDEKEKEKRGTPQEKHEAKEMLHTKQLGNFLYPPEIQEKMDIQRTKRPYVQPDALINDGGWITPSILNKLKNHSPKLAQLFELISERPLERRIIYSKFINKFGLDLIAVLLDLKKIKYTMISGADKSKQRAQKIEDYNKDGLILLINVSLAKAVQNIVHVHFLEGFKYETFKELINMVYWWENYIKKIDSLIIHIHIAILNNDVLKGSDEISYDKFSKQLNDVNEAYDNIIIQSKSLLLEDETLIIS